MLSDTETLESKHTGKYISHLTYDVGLVNTLASNALLNVMKDPLTLISLLFCNVLSKLETCYIFFDNDATFSICGW